MSFWVIMVLLALTYYGEQVYRQLKRLEKQRKGANQMSAIFKDLVNQSVKLVTTDWISTQEVWTVLAVDEDWVKIQRTDKKGQVLTNIVRLDDIKSVELV